RRARFAWRPRQPRRTRFARRRCCPWRARFPRRPCGPWRARRARRARYARRASLSGGPRRSGRPRIPPPRPLSRPAGFSLRSSAPPADPASVLAALTGLATPWRLPARRRWIRRAPEQTHGRRGELRVHERRGVHGALHDPLAQPEVLVGPDAVDLHRAVGIEEARRGAADDVLWHPPVLLDRSHHPRGAG